MTREDVIYSMCIEWAEAAWLRARRGGMDDPVVELRAMDPTDPGWVLIVANERGKLVRGLAPHCLAAARALRAVTPGSLFTVLITTPSGATVYHLPAPEGGRRA
jgi:hypothetical protein